jgi:hypothetical protein
MHKGTVWRWHTYMLTCACAASFCFTAAAVCFRAGELSAEELEQLMTIVANPQQYKIPNWFLNRCEAEKRILRPGTAATGLTEGTERNGQHTGAACSSGKDGVVVLGAAHDSSRSSGKKHHGASWRSLSCSSQSCPSRMPRAVMRQQHVWVQHGSEGNTSTSSIHNCKW